MGNLDKNVKPTEHSFIWGSATSAFQIEGATDREGRGPSIWDEFCTRKGAIVDGSDGRQACGHYDRLEQDLDLMTELNLQAYRFSVSWPRVQPAGKGDINKEGLAFYDRLIDGLLERDIRPFMTLYHWDLPLALHHEGGWESRDTCQRFADYAALLGHHFRDRVTSIATFNEPWVVSTLGYERGIFAPGLRSRKVANQVSHHLLLAHGLAIQRLREITGSCELGIVLNQGPVYPISHDESVVQQAILEDGLLIRWYMDPLFKGNYPADILTFLGEDAPVVESDDMSIIRSPIDFLGINYYTVNRVGNGNESTPPPSVDQTDMGWEICADGLNDLLQRLQRDYSLPPIYITENGAAFADHVTDGKVHDAQRIRYISQHIDALFAAMREGVDVRGYFLWSLFDNFEWAHGYTKRFGMVYVDYSSQARILKDSALWYAQFIESQQQRLSSKSTPNATTGDVS